MKKLLILVPVVLLTACASAAHQDAPAPIAKVPDFDVRMMTRTEVIAAVNQCETNDMKPFIEYISQKTEFGAKVMVPINVHCDPIRHK